MTVEYLVLGVIVLLMSAGQIYFRHFAGGNDPEAVAQRKQVPTRRGTPGGKLWQGWTAVLGGVGVILSIILIVLGVLGR